MLMFVIFLYVFTNFRMFTSFFVSTLYNDGGLLNLFFFVIVMCVFIKFMMCIKFCIVVLFCVGCFVFIIVSLLMFFIVASKYASEIFSCSRNFVCGNLFNMFLGLFLNMLKYCKIDVLNFGFVSV